MPKKKKPSKNGFFQFALEIRDKNPQKFPNIQAAVDHANVIWARMSIDEREPFNKRAQLVGNNGKPIKYTTDGQPIDEIEKQQEEEKMKLQEMKNEIRNMLQNAKINNAIADEEFLIIDINTLIFVPSENKYYICEIAIVPFTLKNGIDNDKVYHEIVMPGKLPLGFYGDAQIHSKETHQLLDYVKDEDNTELVYRTLMQYLEKYKKFGKLPILYTNSKCLEIVQKILNDILYDIRSKYTIKVYNLQYLFYILRNAVTDERIVWQSEGFSDREIERDVYAYTSRIACDYHEEIDVITYCSRSRAIRFAYIICDNCCTDLGIPLIPGKHVPHSAKLSQPFVVNPQKHGISAAPSCDSLWSNADALSEYSMDAQWDIVGLKKEPNDTNFVKPRMPKAENSGISRAYSRETVWSNSDLTENDPDDQWRTVASKKDNKPKAGQTMMPAGMRTPLKKNAKFPSHGFKK